MLVNAIKLDLMKKSLCLFVTVLFEFSGGLRAAWGELRPLVSTPTVITIWGFQNDNNNRLLTIL